MLVQNNSRMTNRRVRFDFKLRLQDIPKVPRLNKSSSTERDTETVEICALRLQTSWKLWCVTCGWFVEVYLWELWYGWYWWYFAASFYRLRRSFVWITYIHIFIHHLWTVFSLYVSCVRQKCVTGTGDCEGYWGYDQIPSSSRFGDPSSCRMASGKIGDWGMVGLRGQLALLYILSSIYCFFSLYHHHHHHHHHHRFVYIIILMLLFL